MAGEGAGRPAEPDGGLVRSVVGYLVRLAVMLAIGAAVLFGISWRLDWTGAWLVLGLTAAMQALGLSVILSTSPDLIAERSRMQEGTKSWDKPLVLLQGSILPMVSLIVAAVDKRLGWSPDLPLWLIAAATACCAAGMLFTLWAVTANRFFAVTVRIQTDRGHHVIDGGPYALMRHPGYLGGLVTWAMMPLILETLWLFVLTALCLAVTVTRIRLEDATLRAELEGYADYARRVRWRLLPGVW